METLAAAVLVAAVFAGWRVVAAIATFAGLAAIAAPVFCVSGMEAGPGAAAATSCESSIGLPPIVALPLLFVGPVGAWVLVSRRESR